MRLRFLVTILAVLTFVPSEALPDDQKIVQTIERLVKQLNDDQAEQRNVAEKQLLELAGSHGERIDYFLEHLPSITDQMPPAVRDRLTKIRLKVEIRAAQGAATQSLVTLTANKMLLAEVFAALEQQTGNRLLDNREAFGQVPNSEDRPLTFQFEDEPFWSVVDQVLDQADLSLYNFAGEDALAIVARGSEEAPRHGQACYSGPFRFEVLEVQAQRNFRNPDRQSLKIQLEIAWEPRLRPIALSQPAANLSATDEAGQPLAVSQPGAMLNVEAQSGNQATELILPFELPERNVTKIASLRGKLLALVPGRQVTFRFDNLTDATSKTERQGGVQVTLDRVRKNNQIWEVHMRLKLEEENRALESHRGWVFQNVSYLVGDDGEPIDNVGFETTLQRKNEIGIAYLFDLPQGIEGLSWVYETPAAIMELPVEYEIRNIKLP